MSHFGTTCRAVFAAATAAVALAAASPVGAVSYLKMNNASMVTTYTATITGSGAYANINGTYASNGISFQAQASDAAGNVALGAPIIDLFGFCVDVFHTIDLGPMGGDVYQSNQTGAVPPVGFNPLRNDFYTYNGTQVADDGVLGTTPYDLAGHSLNSGQLTAITGLVDTGLWLHNNEATLGLADTRMRLAAIQAAIWYIEVDPLPNLSISVSGPAQYQTYFNNYRQGIYGTGNYANKADANDSFYVISDWQQGANEPLNSARSGASGINQAFAIGWPVPNVPEPESWALMIMGFAGIGAALRRRRAPIVAC